MTDPTYSASHALLDALMEQGVSHIFANLGSDHPALVEALAQARHEGRPIPEVIICPNEMAGMSAAHGFWQVSGRPQAMIVHVDCGTQALAGAVHNAAKGRAPILIFAGASPYTQEGELKGSRNEFIHWIQDVHDQRGIVRGYVRYANELRSAVNIKDMVHRAMQFARSDPKGPVYLVGPREVMEGAAEPSPDRSDRWVPVSAGALTMEAVTAIGTALLGAERPLIVTSFVGRNPAAVAPLVALCEKIGIGVSESVPNAMNFPHGHSLYLGNQWNQPFQNPHLAAADSILVIDSDVPWIPTVSRPADDARIFQIDVDPLKEQMPLWHIGAETVCRADAETALRQLLAWVDRQDIDGAAVARRTAHYAAAHKANKARLTSLERVPANGLTAEHVIARVRAAADADTIFLSESISLYHAVFDHLALNLPGQIFTSGGGSLGWNGGAAVGAKLAAPDKTVVAFTGDGSFMFSVPASVHWMARRYDAPFVHIVFNNRGWKSPKLSALAVHPDGYAAHADRLDTSFEPAPDYVGIAAASGNAWGRQIREASEVDDAVREALRVVREERRSAVIDVWLDHH